MRIKALIAIISLMIGLSAFMTSASAAASPNCNTGTWNSRLVTGSSCSWGWISKNAGNVYVNHVLVDSTPNAHGCAVFRAAIFHINDPTTVLTSNPICNTGSLASRPVQWTFYPFNGYGVEFQVCDTDWRVCTNWQYYLGLGDYGPNKF